MQFSAVSGSAMQQNQRDRSCRSYSTYGTYRAYAACSERSFGRLRTPASPRSKPSGVLGDWLLKNFWRGHIIVVTNGFVSAFIE